MHLPLEASRWCRFLAVALAVWGLPFTAWSQVDADARARLVAERQALIERFAAEESDCRQRFVVTSCVDDVRARRRAALAPLRERELQLDEVERGHKAATRKAAIAAKQAAMAARPAASASPEVRVRRPEPAARAASAAAPTEAASAAPRSSSSGREVQARDRAQELRQRQQEAQVARDRIERRQAEREARGRKSDPLPVPAAPSAPAR